jgi:ankyrin repeat protein
MQLAQRIEFYRECAKYARRENPGENFTVLMEASRRGDREAVDHLLSSGTQDVNAMANGATALYMAVEAGSVSVVSKLLTSGASVVCRTPFGLLSLACGQRTVSAEIRRHILSLLLRHGADVNRRDGRGNTPLMAAREAETAELFLQHGADVDAINHLGMTALHMAVGRRDTALAEVLIKFGSNVNAHDVEGKTPLDYALAESDADMIRLLRQHGGRDGSSGK